MGDLANYPDWEDFVHMPELWVIVGEEKLCFVTSGGFQHWITLGNPDEGPDELDQQNYWLIDGKFHWTENPFWIGDLFYTGDYTERLPEGSVWYFAHRCDDNDNDLCSAGDMEVEVIYRP